MNDTLYKIISLFLGQLLGLLQKNGKKELECK